MAKIYSYDYDKDLLLNLYREKLQKNDLIGALLVTNTLKNHTDYGALDLLCKRADIYYRMNHFARSCEEWFEYLSLATTVKQSAKAYNGLGACFYKLQENGVAGYYFNKQILADKKAFFAYSGVTAEFFEEMLSPKRNYYLAYPYDKADFTKNIYRAEEKLKMGEYKGTLNELAIIPETSKQYPLALITSSIAKFFLNDIDGAITDIETSISIEKSTIAICNAISIFTSINNDEKANYYLAMLDVNNATGTELYKILLVHTERGNDKLALSLGEKYLRQNPFDYSVLFLLGLISYNLKDYKKSYEYFKKCYQINGTFVEKHYLKIAENPPKKHRRLEYTFDLPNSKKREIIKSITLLLSATNEERLKKAKEIYEICDYAFSVNAYQIQSSIVTILGETELEKSVEIMKKALISLNVYDKIKSGIIGFLTANGFDGTLDLVYANVFKKVTIYKADFDDNKLFLEAYSYLVCKIAPLEKDLKPLKISAEEVYKKLLNNNNANKVNSVKALSALIYELSNMKDIKSRRDFLKFFDTNGKQVNEIKRLLT